MAKKDRRRFLMAAVKVVRKDRTVAQIRAAANKRVEDALRKS